MNFDPNSTPFGGETPENSNEPWFLTKKNAHEINYTVRDTVFAWLSVLVCLILVRMTPFAQNTLGAVIGVCLLFLFCGVYFKLSGMRHTAKTIAFGAMILIFTVGFLTCANEGLHRLLFLWIVFLLLYWIYTVFQLNGNKVLGEDLLGHAARAILVIPARSIGSVFLVLLAKGHNTKGGRIAKTLLWILLGLCCAVIPTVTVILFLSYDEQFTSLLDKIFSFDADKIFEWIGDLILAFLFALVLFGALLGSRSHHGQTQNEAQSLPKLSCHVVPRALVCAAVTPVLAVYVLFFISQWDYYISAFTKTLPETLTYADYAREGFFQLCWVCAINAVMLLLFNLLIKRTRKERNPLRTVYSVLISIFTLILVATALSKMLLYIDSYGLTRKRVYASWMILLLAVCFVIVLIRQIVKRLPMIRLLAISFAVFFGMIAILNVDSMIASYNVDAYLNGRLQTVDVEAMAEYEVSSVPALTELMEALQKREARTENEQALLTQANDSLWYLREQMDKEENGFLTFNFPKHRAKRLLKDCHLVAPVTE